MKHFKRILFLLLLTLGFFGHAETVVTFRVNENEGDTRYNYDYKVLELALEKTKEKYGPYALRPSPPMNFSRALTELRYGNLKNFFIKHSYDDEELKSGKLAYAKFPVDLGVVGNRVCFINQDLQKEFSKSSTLDDLFRFSFLQGTAWVDVKILEAAHFKVFEKSNYKSLFLLTAKKRFDLFCRGINEILSEYQAFGKTPGLALEKNILIYYDLPRVFYGNKKYAETLKRIEEGLIIAHSDGSLLKIWKEEYLKSILFAKIGDRKIIPIKNNYIKTIDFNYRQYYVNLDTLNK